MMSKYLRNMEIYDGIAKQGSEARIQKAVRKIGMMTATGMHDSNVNSEKLLRLCKTMVLPAATCGIHLTS